MTFYVSTDLVA